MKTPEQIKETRIKNINGHHKNATERGREVDQNCLNWVGRWGYVSGPSLALFVARRLGVKRPFIASELVSSGLLEAVKIPADQREKVGGLMKIYRVSKDACRNDKSLPPYRKNLPNLTNFSHTLTIQDFIATMVNPDPLSRDWMTEYECQVAHKKQWIIPERRRHIPIPDAVIRRGKNEIWIEIETTPKNGVRRDLMATQYENLFRTYKAKGYFGGQIEGVVIVVPNKKVMDTYQQKSFGAKSIQPAERWAREYRYSRDSTAHEIHPESTFSGRIWLTYRDEETGEYPGLDDGLIWRGHPADMEPIIEEKPEEPILSEDKTQQEDELDAESIAEAKLLLSEFESEHPQFYEQYTAGEFQNWLWLRWKAKEDEASVMRGMVSMWNAWRQYRDTREHLPTEFEEWVYSLN